MKLETKINTVEKNNITGVAKVNKIAAHGGAVMIWQMLRGDLYTKKLRAVIREYSTNAYDEHIACGKPNLPIRITLPTALEPNLKIQDFGRGLSEEQITDIYCTLTESTKRESNDFNGAMGLGSKSGSAYSDFWQVTSIHNGTRIEYSMFINEENESCHLKLLETPDNSPSGITVTIPIKKSDISQCHDLVAEIAHDFVVKPELIGSYRAPIAKVCLDTVEIDGVEIKFNKQNQYNRQLSVLMANVNYPIDTTEFGIVRNNYNYYHNVPKESGKYTLPDEVISKLFVLMQKFEIEIQMPTGEVSVAMSREGLQYTERTKAKIFALLSKLPEAYNAKITEKFKDNEVLLKLKEHDVWNNTHMGSGKKRSINMLSSKIANYNSINFFRLNSYWSQNKMKERLSRVATYSDSMVELAIIVIDDMERKESAARFKAYRNACFKELGIPEAIDHHLNYNFYLVKIPNTVDQAAYLAATGLSSAFILKASDLPDATFDDLEVDSDPVPKPPKVKLPPKKVAKEKRENAYFIPTKNNYHLSAASEHWMVGKLDPAVKNYVIPIASFRAVTPNSDDKKTTSAYDIANKVESLKFNNIIGLNDNVFGVREKDIEAALADGCILLSSLNAVKNKLAKYLNTLNSHERCVLRIAQNAGLNLGFDAKTDYGWDGYMILKDIFGGLPDSDIYSYEAKDKYTEIIRNFPLLEYVDNWNVTRSGDRKFVDYIKLVLESDKTKLENKEKEGKV